MDSSAAALFRDGHLVAAVEEERLSRIKNHGGMPWLATAEVLRLGGITLADVDEVAVYWQPWRLRGRVMGTLAKAARDPGGTAALLARVRDMARGGDARQGADQDAGQGGGLADLFRLRSRLTARFGPIRARIAFHDHHLTHQLYAEAMRDWPDAISLSYDGGGEDASTVLSILRGGQRTEVSRHRWPNSLGHFYSVFTGYLGFRMLEGEYKMMGLAPYGRPVWRDALLAHVLRLDPGGRYRLDTRLCDYHGALRGRFSPRLAALLCPPRAPDTAPTQAHMDLAASVQAAFEAAQAHVLAPALAMAPDIRRIVISGGCALNVSANGQLAGAGLAEAVAIPPAPHDAGCAVGAGLASLAARGIPADPASVRSPYLGAAFSAGDIGVALRARGIAPPDPLTDAALVAKVAARLAQGQIVAWFQGRAEFGPRALGARSYLADPRRDAIREDLNAKIKKRELFRPFAPSVTAEAAAAFFEIAQASPYMNIVARVRPDRAGDIPAVTHIDGTARVHTVAAADNPLYHALLAEFGRLTGVPVLLNTSFNIQEPIVYSPADALATFAGSGVDALALGPFLITREALG